MSFKTFEWTWAVVSSTEIFRFETAAAWHRWRKWARREALCSRFKPHYPQRSNTGCGSVLFCETTITLMAVPCTCRNVPLCRVAVQRTILGWTGAEKSADHSGRQCVSRTHTHLCMESLKLLARPVAPTVPCDNMSGVRQAMKNFRSFMHTFPLNMRGTIGWSIFRRTRVLTEQRSWIRASLPRSRASASPRYVIQTGTTTCHAPLLVEVKYSLALHTALSASISSPTGLWASISSMCHPPCYCHPITPSAHASTTVSPPRFRLDAC